MKTPDAHHKPRPYLVIIRMGTNHGLQKDGTARNFDLALSAFATPREEFVFDCEYLVSGGLNKLQASQQIIDDTLLARYEGFLFLDDDLEISYRTLSSFLDYCHAHRFQLAQPSLSSDSFFSHRHLINARTEGWRTVPLVEVMCPWFSPDALRTALPTFDWSYSTWGVDIVWPELLRVEPVVVDEFRIRHTKPVTSKGPLYRYMRDIGISPRLELKRLRRVAARLQARSSRHR